MKTKGHWVIKTSTGLYWCGQNLFDEQIRKAQIYHWKEKAEEQIQVFIKRKYLPADITYEVIAVAEPKELKDTEAEWVKIERDIGKDRVLVKYQCSVCGVFLVCKANFCPNCGKKMTNPTTQED